MGLGMTQSGARMPRNMLQRGKKEKRSMVVTLRQWLDEENENSVSWVGASEQSMTDYISLSPCLTCFSESYDFFKLMLVLDYDEEDDGFAFSRTRSKKSKAEPPKRPEPITEVLQEEKVGVALTRKPRKKSVDLHSAVLLEIPVKEKRRRSPRNSADQTTADPPPIHVKKKRVKDNKTSKGQTDESMQSGPVTFPQDRELPKATERREISWDATKITLPFADTPIIRRNKEMRDNRRSSLGMRGRRASSLIDSGKSNGDFVFYRT